MTNICFLIFAQIRAKFRLFLLCWVCIYFQFIRSNLGEQVSLNKKFCSALGCISVLLFDNLFIFLTNFFHFNSQIFSQLPMKLFKPFSSLLVNFFENFSNKIQNPFSLFHAYKIFSPWTRKISTDFLTKTKPKSEENFQKSNQNSTTNWNKIFKNQTETLMRIFKTKSKPQSKPNRKENKLRRNRIENKTNFIVTHDVLCYNQIDKLEFDGG